MLRSFYNCLYFLWHTLLNTLAKMTIKVQGRFHFFAYDRWLKKQYQADVHCVTLTTSNRNYFEKILLFLVVNTNEPSLLLETVQSCQNLLNPNWELFLVFDPLKKIDFDSTVLIDQRIKILSCNDPYAVIVEEITREPCNWVTFVEIGDKLSPIFISEVEKSLQASTDSEIVYFDEDYFLPTGERYPYLKPDWSPEYMLASDFLSRAVVSSKLIERLGCQGVSPDFSIDSLHFFFASHAQNILHIPKILFHRRAIHPSFLPVNLDSSRVEMVKAFLATYGVGEVDVTVNKDGIRVFWDIIEPPLVSVIIPTKDNFDLIQKLINSMLKKTKYAPFEIIIVDNGSTNNDVLSFYREMANDHRIQVLFFDEPFNYSRYNNIGAQQAKGEVLIFLNNDMEVISPDWMEELVRWAMLPEIGAVGGMLLYPDGTIQHAGIVIGLQGHASHLFLGESPDVRTIFGRPTWYRNVSAVTGACLAVRKEVFDQVGGFDENFILAFNDVEFCVRLLKAGYRNLYNPFARLIHYEGRSRGKYIPESDILYGYEKLKDFIADGDPYFNPNLSHLMNTPTLRRSFEGSPSERLEWIRANAVRKMKVNGR